MRLQTLADADRTDAATRRRGSLAKLASDLRGDLDWIVLKCLEKDRARRYDSVSALAQDIQRHLHHEPIVARPPTWSYRFRKAVERNKAAFAGASAITVVLLISAVLSKIGRAHV